MAKVSLAQALKVKSRLSKEIGEITADIQKWNSVLEGVERALDPAAAYEELKAKTSLLAQIKGAIQRANEPIQDKIFLLAETKGLLAILARLNTSHGPSAINYTGEIANYSAALTGAWAKEEQKRLTKQLNDLQDEIDAFNAITTMELDIPE